jgi:CBS-domain-containing membrane protein
MTPHFIRQLVIHTICNVTGETPESITSLDRVELNTRDWEQVFSRLETTLDIQTGMLTSTERAISIDALTRVLLARLTDNIIT